MLCIWRSDQSEGLPEILKAMEYRVIRTDRQMNFSTGLSSYVAEQFENDVALKKLEELETVIFSLSDNPYLGIQPRYNILRHQGNLVLIKKDLLFLKIMNRER